MPFDICFSTINIVIDLPTLNEIFILMQQDYKRNSLIKEQHRYEPDQKYDFIHMETMMNEWKYCT